MVEQPYYDQSERPKTGATPTRVTYRITADDAAIHQAKRKAGYFWSRDVLKHNSTQNDLPEELFYIRLRRSRVVVRRVILTKNNAL
ncbi:hypothetical protein [Adonisia turfae]|uniref:hypothetical protein n=1 Tax=Adonisia turfae TaxID=2950184 RepID=UPI002029AAC7|nr:hypothetical protein [Adonisia turfae]